MKIIAWSSIFTMLLALSGCIRDKSSLADHPISFSSSIDGPDAVYRDTRAAGNDWYHDDVIGIYMMTSGGTIATHSLSTNAMHHHSGGGNFIAEPEHELFYPRIGKVDFVAYHPWRPTSATHHYNIDVSDQSDHAAIDLIYSDNATGHSSGDVPFLEFHHMLSKLVFNVYDITGTSLDTLSAVISGLSTRGIFDLSKKLIADTGGKTDIAAARLDDGDNNSSTARLEAIVLPESGVDPVVTFTFADGATASLLLSDKVFASGKIYVYNITVTEGGKVEFAGGTIIVDWDDQDLAPEKNHVSKTDPDDPDNPDNPDDPSKKRTQYFVETLGGSGSMLETPLKIDSYTGWDNAAMSYSDRFGGADIRSHGSLDAHIYFPPTVDADLRIESLPTGYDDITLSYDITSADMGGVHTGAIRVYAGSQDVSLQLTKLIPSPNRYMRVSIDLPSGVTSVRFVSDGAVNTYGMRIDNIRLEGVGTPTKN